MRGSSVVLLVGLLLTGTLLYYSGVWLSSVDCFVSPKNCETNFEQFLLLSPNEAGDALAGLAGSIALIWVVIAVLIQSLELRAQHQEMSQMVDVSRAQLAAMQKQTELLELERKLRSQEAAEDALEGLLPELKSTIISHSLFVSWRREVVLENGKPGWEHIGPLIGPKTGNGEPSIYLENLNKELLQTILPLRNAKFEVSQDHSPTKPVKLHRLIGLLQSLQDIENDLPPTRKAVVQSWCVAECSQVLRELENAAIWKITPFDEAMENYQ